jgi:hypothetical protein
MIRHISNIQIEDFIDKYKNRSGFVLVYPGKRAEPHHLEGFERALKKSNIINEDFEIVFHIVGDGLPKENLTTLIVKEGGGCLSGPVFNASPALQMSSGVLVYPILAFVQKIT